MPLYYRFVFVSFEGVLLPSPKGQAVRHEEFTGRLHSDLHGNPARCAGVLVLLPVPGGSVLGGSQAHSPEQQPGR